MYVHEYPFWAGDLWMMFLLCVCVVSASHALTYDSLSRARLQAQLVFYIMLMPNQELAHVAWSAPSLLSVLLSGAVIPLAAMGGPLKWLTYLSVDRYILAGILYHFFSDCRADAKAAGIYGTPLGAMQGLQLDVFDSAGKNAAVVVCFYLFYTIGGFLCLKHLHRERR